MPFGFLLTDADGCVLERWVDDRRFAQRMDNRRAVAGFRCGEGEIGTTSAAVALETGSSVLITGREHFADDSRNMASAGAPIVHPVTKRLLGSLNLCCPSADAAPPMLQLVRDTAALIESRILDEASENDRLLLESFLRGKRDSRHPVFCVNQRTVIGNASAMALLPQIDHGALWEAVAHASTKSSGTTLPLSMPDSGRAVHAVASQILDGGSVIGVELRLQTSPEHRTPQQTAVSRRSAPATGPPILARLAGRSASWRQFCSQLEGALKSGEPILLYGERGVGKTRILRELASDQSVISLDAADAVSDGATAWRERLEAALRADVRLVTLDNLDLLPSVDLEALHEVIRHSRGTGPTVVSSRLVRGLDASAQSVEDFEWPGLRVRVPTVFERVEDIGPLVDALTAERSGGGLRPSWAPETLRLLGRVPWRENLTTLGRVVGLTLRQRTGPQVQIDDLPTDVVAIATRYELGGLDRVEAQAILAALADAEGNKKLAADMLGIARSTLYRKVRALGLDLGGAIY